MEQELWNFFVDEFERQSSVFVVDDAIYCSIGVSAYQHIFGPFPNKRKEYAKNNPPKWEQLSKVTWELLCEKDPRYNSIKILYI